MTMNERANRIADELVNEASWKRVAVSSVRGARVIDCGVAMTGSLSAGIDLAKICMADLAEITYVTNPITEVGGPAVQVITDDPVRACLLSQYAGWQVKVGKFFAMASGPMRAISAREEIFEHLSGQEHSPIAVGVLETRKLPTEEVVESILAKLNISETALTILVAPASSLAGTTQVVARSVETALHKLHELKFDVREIVSAHGVAPLPPVAKDELEAIGQTNDAILYGGRVTLWTRSDDEILASIGPKVPSCASSDHGALFIDLFKRYGDFYKIDPLLFSPAVIEFRNLNSGRTHIFGKLDSELLLKSFGRD